MIAFEVQISPKVKGESKKKLIQVYIFACFVVVVVVVVVFLSSAVDIHGKSKVYQELYYNSNFSISWSYSPFSIEIIPCLFGNFHEKYYSCCHEQTNIG